MKSENRSGGKKQCFASTVLLLAGARAAWHGACAALCKPRCKVLLMAAVAAQDAQRVRPTAGQSARGGTKAGQAECE